MSYTYNWWLALTILLTSFFSSSNDSCSEFLSHRLGHRGKYAFLQCVRGVHRNESLQIKTHGNLVELARKIDRRSGIDIFLYLRHIIVIFGAFDIKVQFTIT